MEIGIKSREKQKETDGLRLFFYLNPISFFVVTRIDFF